MSKDQKISGERIAKIMARAGLCSRRQAEAWIESGRVQVNGRILQSPACVVTPDDKVLVDGKVLPQKEPTRLWRFHKPAGLVTTHKDEKGRKTVFDVLPQEMGRVISVGRLDLNTEGLLLLTNDGALSRHMELPQTGWARRYRVRVHGRVKPEQLARLEKGIRIDGFNYGAIQAEIEQQREAGKNQWLSITLREGKNREIRRVLEALDLQVTRLIRVSYGPFQLGNLPRGALEAVPQKALIGALGKSWFEQG